MESANKMRFPLTICGFHLQFADSTCSLRTPLTIADSATAQFNDTNNLLFVCGFHKLFWIPQCIFRKFAYFWSNFERYNDLSICLWNPKQHRRSKKSNDFADSAYNAENAQFDLVMEAYIS